MIDHVKICLFIEPISKATFKNAGIFLSVDQDDAGVYLGLKKRRSIELEECEVKELNLLLVRENAGHSRTAQISVFFKGGQGNISISPESLMFFVEFGFTIDLSVYDV